MERDVSPSFNMPPEKRKRRFATHNIVPVEVVHNIHDDEHGEETNINLADECLLSVLPFFGGQTGNIGRRLRFGALGDVKVCSCDFNVVSVGLAVDIIELNILDRHDGSRDRGKYEVGRGNREHRGR